MFQLKQVLPLYRDHEIDRTSLETAEEKENFDVDWKKSRARIPELTYNLDFFQSTSKFSFSSAVSKEVRSIS